jgi:hypothetical protein
MQSIKVIAYVGDLIPLRIEGLNVVYDRVEFIDQSALPTLNAPKVRVHPRTLFGNLFQIAFSRHPRKMLIQNPTEAYQMLHQLAPRNTLVRMFEPRPKILLQFDQPFLNA